MRIPALVCLVAVSMLAVAQESRPLGSIEGKVVNSITGAAVKKVAVTLMGPNDHTVVETDEQGVFRFEKLAPGRYGMMAQKTGFEHGHYRAPLDIASGQVLKSIEWKLAPTATISGKIFDSDGDPVQNVMVMPLAARFEKGRKTFAPGGQSLTNDQGEFRIGNLAAGQYLVMASNMLNNAMSGMMDAKPAGEGPERATVTTYYPGTVEQSAASPVEAHWGEESRGIEIRLAKVDAFRVAGRWKDAPTDGKMTLVVLTPRGSGTVGMIAAQRTTLKPDGSFAFHGVPPGDYLLSATQDFVTPLGGQIPVMVKDRNLTDVTLNPPGPVEITGMIALEGQGSEKLDPKHVTVRLAPRDFLSLQPLEGKADEAGKFTLKNVIPGHYEVTADTGMEALYVKSMRFSGHDVEPDGFEAAPGKLEVVLSSDVATVRGTVNDGDGKPLAGATVVLVSSGRHAGELRDEVTDASGRFGFGDLPPGDYKLLAWESVEHARVQDPEFVAKHTAKAESFTLDSRGQKVYSLVAIPK